MRQKIRFEKNIKDGILTVLESSEVDPGVVIPLLEEDYNLEEMVKASEKGFQDFSRLLRRRSFFPTSDLCIKLYETTIEFFKNKEEVKVIVEYDDSEAFPKEEKFRLEDEDVEIDKILEEDGDTKEDELKEIDSEDDTPKFTPEDTSEHEN
ncbi:MAG: hypothetical protein GXP56_16310 [Deltaproteobacteria bacterium]|nr:hypothetical protein [Deltaproteobacteria bacterium]